MQTKIKKGWLTQADIDRLPRPPREETWREWLSGNPGGWSTIILVIVFALGMWGLFAIWGSTELIKTAIKG